MKAALAVSHSGIQCRETNENEANGQQRPLFEKRGDVGEALVRKQHHDCQADEEYYDKVNEIFKGAYYVFHISKWFDYCKITIFVTILAKLVIWKLRRNFVK
jgi:hypothetical protein